MHHKVTKAHRTFINIRSLSTGNIKSQTKLTKDSLTIKSVTIDIIHNTHYLISKDIAYSSSIQPSQ